jgi:hypothetical protein
MGALANDAHIIMNPSPTSSSSAPPDISADWLDQLLASDAADHGGDYIADNGFTARIMQALPSRDALPAWRKPAIAAIWLVAAALLATSLPGTAHEVARGAFRLFAAKPFSLSTLAFVLAALGIAAWTGAAVALRRD